MATACEEVSREMALVPEGVVPAYRFARTVVMRVPLWAYELFSSADHVDPVLEHEEKAAVFLPAEGLGLLKLVRRQDEPRSAYIMVGRVLRALGVPWWPRGTRYFRAEICEFMRRRGLRVFFGREVRPDELPAEEAEGEARQGGACL